MQGVGYRAWFSRKAQRLGLNGWVRNKYDGSVEALLHGPDAILDHMTMACWTGPALARVDKVIAKDQDNTPSPLPQGITIRPTA